MVDYRLTQQADQDLRDIWVYIAHDNIAAADKLLGALFDAFSRLSDYPHMGQKRKNLTSEPFHFFPVGSYLIAYLPKVIP